ncbi:MAG: SMP-30/gluconolactonase/LRE family protein [Bacteroidales bacterium]|jgi:gluconolactonase|nr:SMP-30/gluconolactonase/LRE family protein [Bacteroidales bacterium]MCB9027928.1 SMP-30/gluconolactonase/LRE family protein [Bacteroidales bacterium]HOO66106.1 SMP-30/gluconolactonase/LRE family protein [Bacteroidales bacterium]HPE22296.1 SMP-30/gluconolactonase/LRE family protein [Bacteroidales bacterium]HPJ04330.1 SMP-30/gluconolactonase/LRE family protein [Bacteroidales bacterium]
MKELAAVTLMIFFSFSSVAQEPQIPEALIAKGARVQKAGSGYAFSEGPSVARDGRVFFTDQPGDRIYVWDEKSGITMFTENSGRANGTWFDREGNLIACADLNNSLVKFTPSGELIVVYDKGYGGVHLNGPNDLWQDMKGGIYFTDPYFHRDYWEAGHKQEQDIQAVYYLKPSGELVRVIEDLRVPNGITGTPDGKYLFVADMLGRATWKYTINADGSLGNKTLFAPSGSDGLTIDARGNIYLTAGRVLIYNPEGEKIGEIALPEAPTNVCFGGKKRNVLFITAGTSVFTLKMKVKGVE